MAGQFKEFGAKIAAIRKSHGDSQTAFKERLRDATVDSIRAWERGAYKPGTDNLIRLADLASGDLVFDMLAEAGITIERMRAWLPDASTPPARTLIHLPEIHLATAKDWERFKPDDGEEDLTFDALPLLADAAAAGPAREVDENKLEGWALIHRSFMHGHRPGNVVCIRVKGNSMDPVLTSGSIVGVDVSKRQVTWSGARMALVGYGGDVTVKLVRALPRGRLEISAHNHEAWPTQEVSLGVAEVRGQVAWWWARAK